MNSDNQPSAQDQAALINLLQHVLAMYTMGRRGGEQPKLLPGTMPETLPIKLPLPADARLVGSVVQKDNATVIFDTPSGGDQAVKFYEAELPAQGLTVADLNALPGRQGGFAMGGMPGAATMFCQGESGPWVAVVSYPAPDSITSIHVTVNYSGEHSPCSPKQSRAMRGMLSHEIAALPTLIAPPGAWQMGGGGGGGGENASSRAWLKCELELPAVLEHYNAQLSAAGWALRDNSLANAVAASSWDFRFEDEDWHGFMVIARKLWTPGDYRLTLEAEVEGYGTRGGIVTWS